MEYLENIPFDELEIGQTAEYVKTVTMDDIRLFALISGDNNPLHLDEEYAKTTRFGRCIAHGSICAMIVSAAVATTLPGPGAIYAAQEMKFKKPVFPGDTITAKLKLIDKKARVNIIKIECVMTNQHDEVVFTGVSTAIAAGEKIRVKAMPLPQVTIQ